jgi:uncharacterized protein (DUF1499 family)
MDHQPTLTLKPKRRMTINSLFYLLIAVVILYGCIRLAIGIVSKNKVATGFDADTATLNDCAYKENCHSSIDKNSENRVEPISFNGERQQAIATAAAILQSETKANIVSQTPMYLHATFKTAIMGYIDDVEFLLDDSSNKLHVRSASRLGIKDLGANKKRIKLLRDLMADKL